MPVTNNKSKSPRTTATTTVEIKTTFTEEITSSLLGQTTFFSSAMHSLKNETIFIKIQILITNFKITGQEGLEPSTCGFGDRRSTIGAIDLSFQY